MFLESRVSEYLSQFGRVEMILKRTDFALFHPSEQRLVVS